MAAKYVKPVDAQVQRLDQGIDYQGKVGTPVKAIGLARVDAVKDDPGGFGKAVYYTLLDGPSRGQQIYVGHAAPTVHAGQIVQAGAPVATLQQVSGGNAGNLPGWVEIGLAKNGAPMAQSGDTTAAKQFQKLISNAGDAPAPTPQAPVQTAPTIPSPGVPNVTESPDPSGVQPFQPPPGSGMNSASSFIAELWNRVASQPGASPDTQLLAANAQLTGA